MADITASATVSLTPSVYATGSAKYDLALGTAIADDLFIVDGLAAVTLTSLGSPSRVHGVDTYPDRIDIPVACAKRTMISNREAEASGGRLRVGDAKFRVRATQIPSGSTVDERWTVTDDDGEWRVVQVDTRGLGTQVRLYCRR